MNLANLEVKHKAFGSGVIIAAEGKYITVKFDIGNKIFVYPDIFERFLTLADGSVSDEILADLHVTNERKREIQDKKNEENLRAMTKGIVIPGKETAQSDSDDEESGSKSSDTDEI